MGIYFPSNTKQIIDAIREAIGRPIIAEVVTISGCGVCSLDPVTNTSTNSFCPVCSGTYWIETVSGAPILAHVNQKPLDDLQWVTGGKYFEGDATAQVEYSQINLDLIERSRYFIVDGKRFEKDKIELRGVPNINRIILILKEMEDEVI